jgi:hypothetical protein
MVKFRLEDTVVGLFELYKTQKFTECCLKSGKLQVLSNFPANKVAILCFVYLLY